MSLQACYSFALNRFYILRRHSPQGNFRRLWHETEDAIRGHDVFKFTWKEFLDKDLYAYCWTLKGESLWCHFMHQLARIPKIKKPNFCHVLQVAINVGQFRALHDLGWVSDDIPIVYGLDRLSDVSNVSGAENQNAIDAIWINLNRIHTA